jgi:hypothetical protein
MSNINFVTLDVSGNTSIIEEVLTIMKNPGRAILFVDEELREVDLVREGAGCEELAAHYEPGEDLMQVAREMDEAVRVGTRSTSSFLVSIAQEAREMLAQVPPGNLKDMGGVEGLVSALITVRQAKRYTAKAWQGVWYQYLPHASHTSAMTPVWAASDLHTELTSYHEARAVNVESFDYTREPTSLHTEVIYADALAGGGWEVDGCTVRPPAGTRVVICSTTGASETWKAYTIK